MNLRNSFFLFFIYFGTLFAEEEHFIVFLVNARHLDYTECQRFLKTVAKHPSDSSKNGDVGHAWIYLQGPGLTLEGGHSGERGVWQPRYFEGVLENIALGSENPIAYLWCEQCDGFFQQGNGGHAPTLAAKVMLTEEQFTKIHQFIAGYNFVSYGITQKQCTTFLQEIAEILGHPLEANVTLKIEPAIKLGGKECILWKDPKYATLTFASPDKLEKSLQAWIDEGGAEDALLWYRKTHRKCIKCRMKIFYDTLCRFPERYLRYQVFYKN